MRRRTDKVAVLGCLAVASISFVFFMSQNRLSVTRSFLEDGYRRGLSKAARSGNRDPETLHNSGETSGVAEDYEGTVHFDAYGVVDRKLAAVRNVLPPVGPRKKETGKKNASVIMGSDIQLPDIIIGNKSLCSGVDILVYVQSSVGNFMKRRNIRRTWASRNVFKYFTLKTLFILGKAEKQDDQIKINNEQMLHGDIVEANFTDNVRNISIKSLLALHWISSYCSDVKYVIKTDDDVFLNTFRVVELLLPRLSHNTIACHLIKAGTSPIVRDKNSKWYIQPLIFPNQTHLPQFCSGYVVLMTSRLVADLYAQVNTSPFIQVDDVYVFGQLAQSLGTVKFWDLKPNLTLFQDNGLSAYRAGRLDLVGMSVRTSDAMEEFWSSTLMTLTPWARHNTQFQVKKP